MKPRVLFTPLACLLSAVIIYLAIVTNAPAHGTVKPVTREAKSWKPTLNIRVALHRAVGRGEVRRVRPGEFEVSA